MFLKALVFDFDGLILDTELPEYKTVRETFAAHGLSLSLEDWQHRVGRADLLHWLDWMEELLGTPVPDRDDVRVRRLERHHQLIAENDILPGVLDLVDEAASERIPVAVASSSPSDWVEGHLDRLGVLDRFTTIVTSDHVERAKPWPDLFVEACRRCGAPTESSVALEDSHNGSIAAKAAGLYCVVAPNDITRDHDFDHADWIVDSLAEVTLDRLRSRVASDADI